MCHKRLMGWIKHTIKAPRLCSQRSMLSPSVPRRGQVSDHSGHRTFAWSFQTESLLGDTGGDRDSATLKLPSQWPLPSLHTQGPHGEPHVLLGFQLREGQMVLPPWPQESTEEAGQESELPHSRLYHSGQEINLKT